MTNIRETLAQAARDNIITGAQADVLYERLSDARGGLSLARALNNFPILLYYLGGFIALSAPLLFYDIAWAALGGWGVLGLSLLLTAAAWFCAGWFERRQKTTPAKICAALVAPIVALGIFAALRALGLWHEATPDAAAGHAGAFHPTSNLTVAGGAALAAAAALLRYRYPLVLAALIIALWFALLTATQLLAGDGYGRIVAAAYGALLQVVAIVFARRARRIVNASGNDYAFWLYLVGVILFWGGITDGSYTTAWGNFLYLCANIALLALGAFSGRIIYLICGCIGVIVYVDYLADTALGHNPLFPFALAAVGLALICAGFSFARRRVKHTPPAAGGLVQQPPQQQSD